MLMPEILHYGAAATAILLSALGTGIGQGIAGASALISMSRQPLGSDQSFRSMIIGLALTESGCIFALVISLMLLTGPSFAMSLGAGLAEMGLAIAIGLSSAVVGVASAFAVKASCEAISREPLFSQKIMTLMLLTQSIIEAPVIFAFIIALLIKTTVTDTTTIVEGIKLFSAGLVIALGSVGPAIGQAIFAQSAISAVGKNKEAYRNIFSYSLLSEAVIETPVIFSMLVAFLILYLPISPSLGGYATLASAIAMGVGATGTGIATAYVAAKGCTEIALAPALYPVILQATLLTQAIIETSVIYAFIIALVLVTRS